MNVHSLMHKKITQSLKYFEQLTKKCDAVGTLIVRSAQYPEADISFEFDRIELEITVLLDSIRDTLFGGEND